MRAGWLLVVMIYLLAVVVACGGETPEIENAGEPDVGYEPDVPDSEELAVWLSPTEEQFVIESIRFEVSVDGTAEAVSLYRNGALLTELGEERSFVWNLANISEGAYEIHAEARAGELTVQSESVTIVVDKTAPQLLSTTPEGDSVSVRAPIEARFDEVLAPHTVTAETVQLAMDGSPVAYSVELIEEGRTVSVTLEEAIRPPAELSLTLSEEITDLAGNAFAGGQASWELPVWLDYGEKINGADASWSHFGFDSQTRPVIAFFEQGMDGHGYFYVRRYESGAWVALGEGALNHDFSQSPSFSEPRVLVNDADEIFAIWTEGTDNVFMKRWSDGSWEELGGGALNADPEEDVLGIFTLLDDRGFPVLSWRETTFVDTLRLTVPIKRWNGTEVETLSTGWTAGGLLMRSHLFIANGEPLIVHDTRTSPNELHGLVWDSQSEELVSLTSGESGYGIAPDANVIGFVPAMNDEGDLVVAWGERVGSGAQRLYVRRWNGVQNTVLGTGALNVESSRTLAGTHSPHISLGFDQSGKPLVAWGETDSENSRWYVRRWTGSQWELLGEGPFLETSFAVTLREILVTSSGEVLVITGQGRIDVHRFDGESWQLLGGATVWEGNNVEYRGARLLADDTLLLFLHSGPSYHEAHLHVLEYFDGQWREVGDQSFQINGSKRGVLHHLDTTPWGMPALSWGERDTDYALAGDLYFRVLNR